jgi:hypothetical protein
MARMIPSEIGPTKSKAEQRIYEWFRTDPVAKNWTVFHSLFLEKTVGPLMGEIDFLVLAPNLGIFALEVKGGRVSRQDDGWHFIDGANHENVKQRGPFEQASDGMFTINKILKEKFGLSSKEADVLFGFGVMFPDIVFDETDPGWDEKQIFDARNQGQVGAYIMQLAKYFADKWISKFGILPIDKKPTVHQIDEITAALRPIFDKIPSLLSKVTENEECLLSLTQRQYLFLDAMYENPRILVKGGAGTGKTLLAVEQAIRSTNEKIAFFCYNNNLARFLKKVVYERNPNFHGFVGTIHSYMMAFISSRKISIPTSDLNQPDFYDNELPKLYKQAVDVEPDFFDRLIIDEAQDIITEDYLDVLSCILDQGLIHGKWSFFGDFSKQAIYRQFSTRQTAVDYLRENLIFTEITLAENCRNSFEICKEIEYDTKAQYKKIMNDKPSGVLVIKRTYTSQENEVQQVRQILAELNNKHISGDDIAILSPSARDNSCISLLKEIQNYDGPDSHGPFFSTIHGFKGLESKAVILVDIDDYVVNNQLVYVGISRARDILFNLETPTAKDQRESVMFS